MTHFTHTHRELGGQYAELQQHEGSGPLHGQWLVIYEDLGKGVQSVTTQQDWLENWRALAPDDCTVCIGSGTDHIKNNKSHPCGHCYGLGKMLENGERPSELWDVATVASRIIQRQLAELNRLRQLEANPAIRALLEQHQQQMIDDSMARQDQQWRAEQGYGPGGQRHTGD